MKTLAVPVDAERAVIDLLTPLLSGRGEDVTVGAIVPTTWTATTKPHVLVAMDGTPIIQYPIIARATVRITVWHASTTTAKRLANLSMALLANYGGGSTVASIQPLTGVLPAKDPDTSAQMASVTLRVNLPMAAL